MVKVEIKMRWKGREIQRGGKGVIREGREERQEKER